MGKKPTDFQIWNSFIDRDRENGIISIPRLELNCQEGSMQVDSCDSPTVIDSTWHPSILINHISSWSLSLTNYSNPFDIKRNTVQRVGQRKASIVESLLITTCRFCKVSRWSFFSLAMGWKVTPASSTFPFFSYVIPNSRLLAFGTLIRLH